MQIKRVFNEMLEWILVEDNLVTKYKDLYIEAFAYAS